MRRSLVAALGSTLVILAGTPRATAQLPLEPVRDRGQAVTPAYEGWYRNADGTFTLLVGYFNRNRSERLDVPVGANNRIEPGGPDFGQPTYFLPGRQWGVFTIRVPDDFGSARLTWTLVTNGETNAIPLGLVPAYEVQPFKDPAMGNLPPVLKFQPEGPELTGPPTSIGATLKAVAGQPVTLTLWASDDNHQEPGAPVRRGPPVSVFLSKHRGPGTVTFDNERPKVDLADNGRTTAQATFSEPGTYVVRVQVNDSTGDGGGGFQCCWTNGYISVMVGAGTGSR